MSGSSSAESLKVLCVFLGIATLALLGTTIYFYLKKCPTSLELNEYKKTLKRENLMSEDGTLITPFACGPGTKKADYVFDGHAFCVQCESSKFCPGTRRMTYNDPNFIGPTELSEDARNRLG